MGALTMDTAILANLQLGEALFVPVEEANDDGHNPSPQDQNSETAQIADALEIV